MLDFLDDLLGCPAEDVQDNLPDVQDAVLAAPGTPPDIEIPVDPFGIENPDWAYRESEPPGKLPGEPMPLNQPPPPEVEPRTPVEPIDPDECPATDRSPGVQPPGTEAPPVEIPVVDAPPLDDASTAEELAELVADNPEAAASAPLLGSLAPAIPVALAGIGGYLLGDAIAPYVYGDKNLDGSPNVRYEDVDDFDPDYRDSWAWQINEWLDG